MIVKNGLMPLRAIVKNNCVTISIGVETLAFAFENCEANNPYNEGSGDYEQQVIISDPLQFAKDVCHEMNADAEDGSTPLTRFLDSMSESAVDQGSLGILDPDEDEGINE